MSKEEKKSKQDIVKGRKITSLKHRIRNSLAICLLSYSNYCAKLSTLTKCPEWLMPCCSQFNIREVFSIAPACYICTSHILCHSLLEPEGWLFSTINGDMSKIYPLAAYMFPETQHPSVFLVFSLCLISIWVDKQLF